MMLLLILLAVLGDPQNAEPARLPFGTKDLPIPKQLVEVVVSPRTVELLSSQWSREPTPQLRARTVRDLGTTRSTEALPALLIAIKHSDELVRAEAAHSVGMLKQPSCENVLLGALSDLSPMVRREAVLAAAECGAAVVVSKGLGDAEDLVCLAAVANAGASDSAALLELTRSANVKRQIFALRRLSELSAAIPRDLLDKLLASDSPIPVRIAAVEASKLQGVAPSAAQIEQLAKESNTDLRIALAQWVARCGDARDKQSLAETLLKDQDIAVRSAGLNLIEASPSAAAIDQVRQQLLSGNPLLIASSEKALVAIAGLDRGAVETLAADLFANQDWQARKAASRLLGELRSTAAIDKHVALLRDPEPQVVEAAVQSLSQLESPAAVQAVQSLVKAAIDQPDSLRSSDNLIPARIVSAGLVAMGTANVQAAVSLCETVISRKTLYPINVRCAAIWAFGTLARTDASSDTVAAILAAATDQLEDESVRLESIKALGNMQRADVEQTLRTLTTGGQTHALRWLAHWSLQRVAKDNSAFDSIPARVEPDLSLQSLPDQNSGSVSLNVSLPQGFIPDEWSVVRCVIANHSGDAISGHLVLTPADATSLPKTSTVVEIPPHAQRTLVVYALLPEQATAAELAARGSAGGVALAELISTSGAVIARNSISGQMLSNAENADVLGKLLYVHGNSADTSDPYSLAAEFSKSTGKPLVACLTDENLFPDDPLGISRTEFVLLEDCDPDSLSQAQREALLAFVRQGGTVVVSGVLNDSNWITARLPFVRLGVKDVVVGDEIVSSAALQGLDPQRISAHGGDCFTAAVGRGRIVLSAVRCSDLVRDGDHSRLADLTKAIPVRSTINMNPTARREIAAILPAMIGTPLLSWRLAGGLVGGYCVLTTLCLILGGSRRRPTSFAIATGLAVLLSIAALGFAQLRQQRVQSTLAAVQVIDCNASGGVSAVNEFAAISGSGNENFAITSSAGELRIIGNANLPSILLQPTRVEAFRPSPQQLDFAFQARGASDNEEGCSATALVDSGELRIKINNTLKTTLRSPVLLANSRVYRLPDLNLGDSVITPRRESNLSGDFTNPLAIATEQDRLRGQLTKSLASAAKPTFREQAPVIIGWADQPFDRLIQTGGGHIDIEKLHTAVRIPVSIKLANAGETLLIDERLCRITFPTGGDLTAPDGRSWISTAQTGDWLLCIESPRALGDISPQSVLIHANLFAPSHNIEWRKALCSHGKLQEDASGELIERWSNLDGARDLRFNCSPSDIDQEGRIFLKLSVQCTASPATPWQMRDFSYEVKATASAAGNR